MSFIDTIKYKYKTGSIIEKLIYLNVVIFGLTLFITVFQGLYKGQQNFLVYRRLYTKSKPTESIFKNL